MGTIELAPALVGRVKRAEITAVITRADGTVEELGVIAATDFDDPETPTETSQGE